MSTNPDARPASENGPAFLSVDTVAGILRVDRKTVYEAVRAGVLRAFRLGRVIRTPAAAIAQLAGGPFRATARSRRARR